MPRSHYVRSSDWVETRCSRSRAVQSLTPYWPHWRSMLLIIYKHCSSQCFEQHMWLINLQILWLKFMNQSKCVCCCYPGRSLIQCLFIILLMYFVNILWQIAVRQIPVLEPSMLLFSSLSSISGRRLWSSYCPTFLTRRRMNLQSSVLSRSSSLCLRQGDQRMYRKKYKENRNVYNAKQSAINPNDIQFLSVCQQGYDSSLRPFWSLWIVVVFEVICLSPFTYRHG